MIPSLLDLWFIFLTTLLGSAHCIGMCGGMAAACSLGSGLDNNQPFWHPHRIHLPLLYTLGRLGTYMVLGALTGWLGSMTLLYLRPSPFFALPHLAVGVVMILMGLNTIGLFSMPNSTSTTTGWLARKIFSASPTYKALGLGGLTGLLPCSMHWAFQAKAFTAGSLTGGLFILLAFGLGTLPAMWGFALLSTWLDHRARQRVIQIAGIMIILLGGLSLKRGFMLIEF